VSPSERISDAELARIRDRHPALQQDQLDVEHDEPTQETAR